MFLNILAQLPPLLARTFVSSFFSAFSERIASVNWFEVALIVLIGAAISTVFFLQRSFTYRCLALNTCICAAMLVVSVIFQIRFLMYFSLAVLLLFVILYQQELRELVLKISGARAFSAKRAGATLDMQREAIDAVCQAAVEMSRNKTGALIVMERHIKLDDVARSGIEVDAKTSPYLLRNVFFDKAPLHDGAVIIRNCRIWSAGCILPLTSRTDVDPDLGTRHRAAIGLSEICDAVVVVVSEETGTISVAYQSVLTRDYTFRTLHTTLTKNLLHEDEETTED